MNGSQQQMGGQDRAASVEIMLRDPNALIGDAFPALVFLGAEKISLLDLNGDTRAFNVLNRFHADEWRELARQTVLTIFSWPSVGEKSLRSILTAAAERNEQAIEDGILLESKSFSQAKLEGLEREAGPQVYFLPANLDPFIEAISEFITFAIEERGAETFSDIFSISDAMLPLPNSLLNSATKGLEVPLGETPPSSIIYSADLIEKFFEEIGEDSDILVERKILLNSTTTLLNMGRAKGLSRERIRQLEEKVTTKAVALLEDPRFSVLAWRAQELAKSIGLAANFESAQTAASLAKARRRLDPPSDCPLDDFLLWAGGNYRLEDGWLLAQGASLQTVCESVSQKLPDCLTIDSEDLLEAAEAAGVINLRFEDFPLFAPTRRFVGDNAWVKWEGSIADKAEIVFLLCGTRLDFQELNTHIGEGKSDSYIRNVLTQDDRFIRLGKGGSYALRAWGWEEYSGVAQEMLERIERGGGSVSLSEIIEEFISAFDISANSVKMYATMAPAFVLEGDTLRRRREDEPFEFDTNITFVSGIYVTHEDKKIIHFQVDKDVLRGSGRPLALAAASSIGITPGSQASFSVAGSDLSLVLAWQDTSPGGPTIGSTRGIAELLGAVDGDKIRLTFDAAEETCAAEISSPGSIFSLTGITTNKGLELTDLALAMQCRDTDVRNALEKRGEHDVLELLPMPEASKGLDEILGAIQFQVD